MAVDFSEALEKIALGAERKLTLNPEERRRVAYHEAGHALLGLLQPEGDPVRRVTVVPRGQALGVTLSVPEDDRYNYGEPYLRARIVSALGGRAAEQIVYNMLTTGAENDLKQVSDLARAMVTRFGMSPEIGLVALDRTEDGNYLDSGFGGGAARSYSEETARERWRLDGLAETLLREESLDEAQIRAAAGLEDAPAPVNEVAVKR